MEKLRLKECKPCPCVLAVYFPMSPSYFRGNNYGGSIRV